MVDINLLGDDQTGEEERVEDFTQTSSMDTQELAFEERTETFDTTKTTGLSRRRSYSSLMSTLIILALIIAIGAAAYYFIFSGGDNSSQQAEIPPFTEQSQDLVDSNPAQDINLDNQSQGEEPFTFDEEPVEQPTTAENQPNIPAEQPVAEPPRTDVVTTPRTKPAATRLNVNDVSANFLAQSRSSINSVTGLMTTIPAAFNTTLLSYTGNRARIELIGNLGGEARSLVDRLNRDFGSANFAIVSEDQIAANGGSLDRVLISGSMASSSNVGSNEQVEFLNVNQAQDWIKNTSLQYGLELRQLKIEQASSANGYQKVPVFARIYGAQSSLVGFLQEMAGQNLNLEITKIQLVSPDMVSFSDDNLVLVLYMYLYQRS